jgi:hypothetical protein
MISNLAKNDVVDVVVTRNCLIEVINANTGESDNMIFEK